MFHKMLNLLEDSQELATWHKITTYLFLGQRWKVNKLKLNDKILLF